MENPFTPDFSQSNADMAELVRLSQLCGFDLFVYLRLLSEAGAPTLCGHVDDGTAVTTGGCVVRYQLCEGLQIILAALRARNGQANEVKCRSCRGRAVPVLEGAVTHDLAASL